jgi:hypothetical protein
MTIQAIARCCTSAEIISSIFAKGFFVLRFIKQMDSGDCSLYLFCVTILHSTLIVFTAKIFGQNFFKGNFCATVQGIAWCNP